MINYKCYYLIALISSFSFIIFLTAQGYAQQNTKIATSRNQTNGSESFTSIRLGDIIASVAASIAALGLFLNVNQMKKNQTNFKEQMNATTTQIRQNQEQFLGQMRVNERTTNAQFWLTLREFISRYDKDVHFKLRDGPAGPKSSDEWDQVVAYMGVFEHCNAMIDSQLIDLETFKNIYRYRIELLLENDTIKNSLLRDRGEVWQDFIHLCHIVDLEDKLPDKWKMAIPIKSNKPGIGNCFGSHPDCNLSWKKTAYHGHGL